MDDRVRKIESLLDRTRRRIGLQRAAESMAWASLPGSMALAAGAVAYRLTGEAWWLAAGGVALALCALAGAAVALRRPATLTGAALAADETFGLKERLTTFMDIGSQSGSMRAAQRRDALSAAGGLDFSRVRPLRAPEMARYVGVVIIIAIGIVAIDTGGGERRNDTTALGQALRAAADRAESASGSVSAEDLGPDGELIVREIKNAAADMRLGESPQKLSAELKRLEEHIEKVLKDKRKKERLEAIMEAVAGAREAIDRAGTQDGDGGFGGAPDGDIPAGGPHPAVASKPRDGLAREEALSMGRKRYPEYAAVLRRYFAPPRD